MLDDRDAPTRSGGSRALGWIAWAFGLAGTAALAWTALQVEDAREYQLAARQVLNLAAPPLENGATPSTVESAPSVDAAPLDRDASTSGRDIPTRRRPATSSGAPLGALSIPRLRLSVVVLHGTDGLTLRRGVGHIEKTALPGELGNMGIAGHRDTFFRPSARSSWETTSCSRRRRDGCTTVWRRSAWLARVMSTSSTPRLTRP